MAYKWLASRCIRHGMLADLLLRRKSAVGQEYGVGLIK